ncbi:hypothetical protein MHBO_003973 [Bonamia ostreae]|uniref:Uncharacterized protein n=1 Tax=Bonamia ostreae TaxID=126728 RepID=A0ABV2AS17_9EUKA
MFFAVRIVVWPGRFYVTALVLVTGDECSFPGFKKNRFESVAVRRNAAWSGESGYTD